MEPIAKSSVLDDGVFVLSKLKGRIVLRIDGISEFLKEKRECCSKYVRIRGLDWILFATPFSLNGIEFNIDCIYNGPNWSCAASAILLCNSGGKEVEIGRLYDEKFDATPPWIMICRVNHPSVTILSILTIYFSARRYLGKQSSRCSRF